MSLHDFVAQSLTYHLMQEYWLVLSAALNCFLNQNMVFRYLSCTNTCILVYECTDLCKIQLRV